MRIEAREPVRSAGGRGVTPADWFVRWRDDYEERIALMEYSGVPDAERKAWADTLCCRRREEERQVELFGGEK